MPVIAEGATIPDDAPFIDNDNLIPHETTPFVRHKRRSSSTSSIFPDDFFVPEKLGLVSFSILVFYNVSGGPFGVEASVRAGGNFYSLLGFLVVPLIWSLQEAAMTAELGAAFPEASGGVAWVEEAFGSTAGWMSGYLNWVAGATDNAIYPVLFLEYVMQIFKANVLEEIESAHSDTMHHLIRIFLITAISTSLAYINWMGLELVGRISILICFVAMSPFVLLLLVGAAKCDPSRWFEIPDQIGSDHTVSFWESGFVTTGVLWRPLINNLYWNLNSFDAAGSFAADVDDPNKTFARGMMWGLLLVTIGYFVPLLIATGASDTPHSKWVEGYLAGIAFDVGGVWLGAWTVFAAGVSNIAMFQAEMSADAYQGTSRRNDKSRRFALFHLPSDLLITILTRSPCLYASFLYSTVPYGSYVLQFPTRFSWHYLQRYLFHSNGTIFGNSNGYGGARLSAQDFRSPESTRNTHLRYFTRNRGHHCGFVVLEL